MKKIFAALAATAIMAFSVVPAFASLDSPVATTATSPTWSATEITDLSSTTDGEDSETTDIRSVSRETLQFHGLLWTSSHTSHPQPLTSSTDTGATTSEATWATTASILRCT